MKFRVSKDSFLKDISLKSRPRPVLAYNLCGWEMKEGCLSQNYFASLKKLGNYERACCLALLTDNYEQALDILESAIQTDPQFGSLWIALRYFIDDQKLESYRVDSEDHTSSCSLNESSSTSNSFVSNTYASQTSNKKSPFFSIDSSDSSATTRSKSSFLNESLKECSKFIKSFTDPYLRAMFNFMINQEKAKDDILFDREILFQDRVALSIYFNFDLKNLSRLQIYFDKLENECIENSDLGAVLLTGLSPRCLDLFQSFIDNTGDLQSICLAVIHSPYLEVVESSLLLSRTIEQVENVGKKCCEIHTNYCEIIGNGISKNLSYSISLISNFLKN
ncbi:WD repeat-containing mio [Brachionus plicatilis]|uniref:WD repeat-containing mio n=1 Tax=Brachionus plicatilis TaxID=10195 RepID=A0A3M7RAV8_BRAPC|nr:WD repeat-containing mio [Brachionus plicatilis]